MSKRFSNSITIARVADGTSADSIVIETNYENILRFEKENNVVAFLPEVFSFKVLNINTNQYISNFSWAVYFLNDVYEFEEIISSNDGDLSDYGFSSSLLIEDNEDDSEKQPVKNPNQNINVWYWDFSAFYQGPCASMLELKNLIDNGCALFKIVYKTPGGSAGAVKYITANNGVSADMAKMFIDMNKISMAVGQSTLEFSGNGLTVGNGDFRMFKDAYEEADIESESDFLAKTELYYIDTNGSYRKATAYVPNTVYYSYIKQPTLTVDDFGDLVLYGSVYANNGVFRGDVFANNGSFQGLVNATEGNIGGFTIKSVFFEKADPSSSERLYLLIDSSQEEYAEIITRDNGTYVQVEYRESFAENQLFTSYYTINDNTLETAPIVGETYYAQINNEATYDVYKNSGGKLISQNENIILDAGRGLIVAENIELGAGAKITGKLVLATNYAESGIDNQGEFEQLKDQGKKIYVKSEIEGEYIEVFNFEYGKDYYVSRETCALYNPDFSENGEILVSSNIKLTREGRLWLGTLELYGGSGNSDGYMRSVQYDANSQRQTGQWSIHEDGTANFNNIYIDNAHIKNAIVENEAIQTIGGVMIFNDSWTIKKIDNTDKCILYFDKQTSLAPENYIYNGDNFYKVVEVDETSTENGEWRIKLSSAYSSEDGMIITKFGNSGSIEYFIAQETEKLDGRVYYEKNGDEYIVTPDVDLSSTKTYYYQGVLSSNDCIISIQGNSAKLNNDFSSPTSLAISSFIINNNNATYTKHLILGKLSESGLDDLAGLTGYGLYADQVYLNGSLVTRANELNSYAGVNTLNTAFFNHEESDDHSSIVFWGGAPSKTEINKAPFQVTAKGTLYAQNAIIKNSVFVGGELEAAKIKTGIIEGGDSSLLIRDAQKGICFERWEEGLNGYKEVFSITENGIGKEDGLQFITVSNNDYPNFYGTFIAKAINEDLKTEITHNGIQFLAEGDVRHIIGELRQEHDISDSTSHIPKIILGVGNEPNSQQYVFEQDRFTMSVEGRFNTNTFYGKKSSTSTYIMEQRAVGDVGFDIYIY